MIKKFPRCARIMFINDRIKRRYYLSIGYNFFALRANKRRNVFKRRSTFLRPILNKRRTTPIR